MKNTINNLIKKKNFVRKIAVVAIMAALAEVLMMLEFSVPFVPSFLKFDFSDLPAYITAFAFGPVSGVLVELIKNLIHLAFSTTSGVGELANFLVGASLVLPAGIIYRKKKSLSGAIIGSACGAVFAAIVSLPVNYFITYPFYSEFMPMDAIISLYKAIIPSADTLFKALLFINVPFTFVKGVVNVAITFLIYKKISPVLKGQNK